MFVCIHIYIYEYMNMYIYIYVCVCVCVFVCMHIYGRIFMYTFSCKKELHEASNKLANAKISGILSDVAKSLKGQSYLLGMIPILFPSQLQIIRGCCVVELS